MLGQGPLGCAGWLPVQPVIMSLTASQNCFDICSSSKTEKLVLKIFYLLIIQLVAYTHMHAKTAEALVNASFSLFHKELRCSCSTETGENPAAKKTVTKSRKERFTNTPQRERERALNSLKTQPHVSRGGASSWRGHLSNSCRVQPPN